MKTKIAHETTNDLHLDDYPEVAPLKAKYVGIQIQILEVDQKIAIALSPQDGAKAKTLEVDANLLLEGKNWRENTASRQEELEELYEHRKVLRKALEIQGQYLQQARREKTQEIVQELQPIHRDVVRRVCGHLVRLAEVLEEEKQFRDALTERGFMFSDKLRPMVLYDAPGSLADPQSTVSRFLAEAEEYGFLSQQEREVHQEGGTLAKENSYA